jgi:predicted P-loop ATPase
MIGGVKMSTSEIETAKAGVVVAFTDFVESKKKPSPAPWLEQCQHDKNGKPLSTLANIMVALRHDPRLCDAFAQDEMLGLPLLMKPLEGDEDQDFKPRPLTDHDVTRAQITLQLAGLTHIGREVTHQAIDLRAVQCQFHPVRDSLSKLSWDGKPRIGTWLTKYLGAEHTAYTEKVGEMFLVSMVARIFNPGCKVDYMLVLEGPQGARKSTACQILGGVWFSDSLPDVTGGKDVSQHLAGKWLIEIAEMSAMTKAESAHLKAFMTRTVERYRPSYGRKEVQQPRQCVFIGTTNQSAYLRDASGGRRFWPVAIGKIDTDALMQDRDQLFAEAVQLYQEGARCYPDAAFEKAHILPEQDARYEEDAWEHAIRGHLDNEKPDKVYLKQLMEDPLYLPLARQGRRESLRLADILTRLGWRRLKKDSSGNIPWGPPPS